MREIKFRGRKINSEKWVVGDLRRKLESGNAGILVDGKLHIVDFETVGQYTGIKDVYGNEIYEGDIVYQEFYDQIEESHGFTGVVKQEEGAWWIDNEKDRGERLWSEVNLNHIKGNKFENPELLQGGTGE